MRYVEEEIDDPFGPRGTRRIAIPDAERAAIELAQQLRRTENEREREVLRDRLRDILSEAFEQRRERQLREIEELERQLESLRRLDAERQERNDDIVRRRMKQLLGEPDVLDWDPPSRQDLAFPFEGPRLPETSPPRSFDDPGQSFNAPGQPPRFEPGFAPGSPVRPGQPSPRGEAGRPAPAPMDDPFGPRPGSAPNYDAPRTTDRRPSPDRRPGGEDETQPEPRRSRGTLRAENIEIELPDGPQGEALGTANVRAANAERILDLTEKIARFEADARREASIRRLEGAEEAERWMASRRVEREGVEARFRLARIEWHALGQQLSEEMKLAQQNLRNVEATTKRVQELFAIVDVPSTEVSEQLSKLARAKAELASAERRVRAWHEMDHILHERTAAQAERRDEADEAPPREASATETDPRRAESGLREAAVRGREGRDSDRESQLDVDDGDQDAEEAAEDVSEPADRAPDADTGDDREATGEDDLEQADPKSRDGDRVEVEDTDR